MPKRNKFKKPEAGDTMAMVGKKGEDCLIRSSQNGPKCSDSA